MAVEDGVNEAYRFAELMEAMAVTKGPSMGDAWARKFGQEPGTSTFLLSLAVIRSRTERIRLQIDQANISDRSKRLYGDALTRLETFVLPQTIFTQSSDALGKQRQSIDLIFLAADALPHELEPEVNELTLNALVAELDALLEAVTSSDIETYLKKLIWEQLSILLTALRAYPIYGADGIAKIMGAAASELTRLTYQQTSEPVRSIYERSVAAIKKVGAAVVWSGAVVTGAHGVLTDGSEILGIDAPEVPAAIECVVVPPE